MQARQGIVGHPMFENHPVLPLHSPLLLPALALAPLGKPFPPLPLGCVMALSPHSWAVLG